MIKWLTNKIVRIVSLITVNRIYVVFIFANFLFLNFKKKSFFFFCFQDLFSFSYKVKFNYICMIVSLSTLIYF